MFHQLPIKQVSPKNINTNPTYIGLREILKMPLVWSDVAGLISIKVFLLWKNFLKLVMRKANEVTSNNIPAILVTGK